MALEYRGTAYDGTPIYFDEEKAIEQARNMSEREHLIAGRNALCFDRCYQVPVHPETKKYEDPEEPGAVSGLFSAYYPGYYHPFDEEGLPVFNVVLDEEGRVVDASTLKKSNEG